MVGKNEIRLSGESERWKIDTIWDFSKSFPQIITTCTSPDRVELVLFENPILCCSLPVNYAFVGGMRYVRSDDFDIVNRRFDFPYPFSTYYKSKIPPATIDGNCYRSAMYCKMPLIMFNSSNSYFGVVFSPIEKSSLDQNLVHSIRFEGRRSSETGDSVAALAYCSQELMLKRNIWLGRHPRPEPLPIVLDAGEEIKTTASIIYGYGIWTEAVDGFFQVKPLEQLSTDLETCRRVAAKTQNAFWRAWDDRLGTFLQLPYKDHPSFLFDDLLFSLTSFEAERMVNFYRYYLKSGSKSFLNWSNRLRKLLLSRNLSEIKNNCRIWHNSIAYNGVTAEGYSYLKSGYAGYPGGQATIALKFLELYHIRRDWEDREDRRALNAGLDALDWILRTQKDNGAWRLGIKVFGEYPARRLDFESKESVGGSAECIRALLLAHRITGEKIYRSAALKGLDWLNPGGFACLGYNYLRDAGVDEEEGISAIIAAHANLDAYETLHKRKFLDYSLAWAKYLLTWHFWWESDRLKIRGGFDPLSFSITPRVAPYETVMVLSVYSRLYRITGNPFWSKIFNYVYRKALDFIEKDGGLSETYFFNYIHGLEDIPVQQTFAASELLLASMECETLDKKISFEVKGNKIELLEKCSFLQKVYLEKGIVHIVLKNNSDAEVSGIEIRSPYLVGRQAEIDNEEIVSRSNRSIFGINLKEGQTLTVLVTRRNSSDMRITGESVNNLLALWNPENQRIKIWYSGTHPTVLVRNSPFEEIFVSIGKKVLAKLSKEDLKSRGISVPSGEHVIRLHGRGKETKKWWNKRWKYRVPLVLLDLSSNLTTIPLVVPAKHLLDNLNAAINPQSIRVIHNGKLIPSQVIGRSKTQLRPNDEIVAFIPVEHPQTELFIYFDDEARTRKRIPSRIRCSLGRDHLLIEVRENNSWREFCRINKETGVIESLKNNFGENFLNERGVGVSFWPCYSRYARLKRTIKRTLRQYYFRLLLASSSVKDALYGVGPKEAEDSIKVHEWERVKKKISKLVLGNKEGPFCVRFSGEFATDFHRLSFRVYAFNINGTPMLLFNPLQIETLAEDTDCRQALVPYIGLNTNGSEVFVDNENRSVIIGRSNNTLVWEICNPDKTTGQSFDRLLQKKDVLGIDVSLRTNWIHAGIYRQVSALSLIESKNPEEILATGKSIAMPHNLIGSIEHRPGKETKLTVGLRKKEDVEKKGLNIGIIYPGATHGIYHYVTHLRKHLQKDNNKTVGFYFPEERGIDPISPKDIPLPTRIKVGEFYFVLPKGKEAVSTIVRNHKKRPFQLLHLHWPTTTWDAYAFKAARKLNIPIVCSLHYALSLQNTAYGYLSRLMYQIGKRYLRQSDQIIVTSKSQESFVKSVGFPNVNHVPTGVDVNVFRPLPLKKRKEKTILYVGRLSPEKNIGPLIKAYLKCDFGEEVRLIIVGKGPLYNSLRSRYGGDNIIVAGYVPEKEKIRLLRHADLFVTMTKMELMSISVLEAMACGVPTIASRIEAFEEFVNRDVGRLISLDSELVGNLSEAISSLLNDDKKRREMGRNARDLVTRLCSWNRVTQRMLTIYEKALE
ncbi:MAG: glycosyltransferase [Promethearchaeota archaeon]